MDFAFEIPNHSDALVSQINQQGAMPAHRDGSKPYIEISKATAN